MKGTYKIKARCSNCGFAGEVEVRLGLELNSVICPTCGCFTLRRSNNKLAWTEDLDILKKQ